MRLSHRRYRRLNVGKMSVKCAAVALVVCLALEPSRASASGVWLDCTVHASFERHWPDGRPVSTFTFDRHDFYFFDESNRSISEYNQNTKSLENDKPWKISNGMLESINSTGQLQWLTRIDRMSLKYTAYMKGSLSDNDYFSSQGSGRCRVGISPPSQRRAF